MMYGIELAGGEAPAYAEADRHRRVQMAPRDVTDGIGHGEDGQTEGERHPEEADTHARERRRQHRAPAAAEDEPEGADELRDRPVPEGSLFHGVSRAGGLARRRVTSLRARGRTWPRHSKRTAGHKARD